MFHGLEQTDTPCLSSSRFPVAANLVNRFAWGSNWHLDKQPEGGSGNWEGKVRVGFLCFLPAMLYR